MKMAMRDCNQPAFCAQDFASYRQEGIGPRKDWRRKQAEKRVKGKERAVLA